MGSILHRPPLWRPRIGGATRLDGPAIGRGSVEASVGSVGDSYDNALAETINGLYKAERIHKHSWKNREAVELATLTWVDWFNHRLLLGPIGYIPPAKAEAKYYQQLTESAKAAWLTTISL